MHNVVRANPHHRAKRGSGGQTTLYNPDNVNLKVLENRCDHFVVSEVKQNNLPSHDTVTVISCYVPPRDTTFLCTTFPGDYYEELNRLVAKYQHTTLVLTGDFNARTGLLKNYHQHCEGSSSKYETSVPSNEHEDIVLKQRNNLDTCVNDYGRELTQLCISSGMCIVNGRVKGDQEGMYTRVHTTGKSTVDYVVIGVEHADTIQGFSVCENMPESDHRPLHFTLKNMLPLSSQQSVHEDQHYNIEERVYYQWDESKADIFMSHLGDEIGQAFLKQFEDQITCCESPDKLADVFEAYLKQE